jgi:CHAT domain-containing protein/Tfp pilus assembly protein PilF
MNGNTGNSSHLADQLLAAYVAGQYSLVEKEEVEEHCIVCENCRARLAILLRVVCAQQSEEQPYQLESLLPLVQQAADRARQQITAHSPTPLPDAVATGQSGSDRLTSSQQRLASRYAARYFGAGGHGRLPYLPYTLAATVVITLALISYFFGRSLLLFSSPAERGLAAMRRAYRNSRPLEARVTGGFTYQPFEEKRSLAQAKELDQDQLRYALSELTQAVASRPTAATRHNLGRLYLFLGEFDQAEEQLTLALKDEPRNAKLHADLAVLYYERSKYADPLPLLAKAIEHDQAAIELDPELAEAWFNCALYYERMALLTKAQAAWERYLELDADSPWATEARERLKKLRERLSQSANLDEQTQAQFLAAEAAGDKDTMRQLMDERFVVLHDFATGRLFDEYLAAASTGETARAGERLNTLTHIAQLAKEIKGDHFIADMVDFAARGSPAIKKQLQEIRRLWRRADREFTLGAYGAASTHYSSARSIAERIGDWCHAEVATLGLARFFNPRTESQAHSTLRERLIANAGRRRHRWLQAQAILASANAAGALLHHSRNLELCLQAAAIAQELGDVETLINSLRFAGHAYARMGDYERAMRKTFEAVSLLRDRPVRPLRAAQAYHQVWEALFYTNNFLTAVDYQREALRMADHSGNAVVQASLIGGLGLTYGKLGRYEEGVQHLNEAIARAETVPDQLASLLLQADLYTSLGDFYLHQNKTDQAITAYRQALEAIGERGNLVYLAAIHEGLAAAYLAQNKWTEAEAELQASIALAEQGRLQIADAYNRSAFLASKQNVYRAMVDFQFTKQNPGRAFNYAEISKGRGLLDALAGQKAVQWSGDQPALILSRSARPLTLEQVQHALPGDVQLVEYLSTEKRLIIWLITRDEVVAASVPINSDQLRRLVTDYFAELQLRRDLESLNRRAAELWNLLISPIAARLDRSRMLCLIPDEALHKLPFAALVSPATRRYLVEDFALAINPSASVLVRTLETTRAQSSGAPERFLGLGNPRFNRQRFPNLRALLWADEEVAHAQAFYRKARVLSRERATESAITHRMGAYEIVHLATHILIDERSPLLSSIVLADEGDRASEYQMPRGIVFDGALRAYEIYHLKLQRTSLIILSGCRSGAGNYPHGEELSVLVQAFLAAGVPTVIASLWDVDDESAAKLMEAFHYHHRVKKQAFGSALRQAQISFIQAADAKWTHPYYWAAFFVTGNGLAGSPHDKMWPPSNSMALGVR